MTNAAPAEIYAGVKETTNAQTSYVCACARVTEEDFRGIINTMEAPTYAALRESYGIGGQCTSCEFEVKGLLDEALGERFLAEKKAAADAKAARKAKVGAPAAPEKWIARFFRRMRGKAPPEIKSPAVIKPETKAKPVEGAIETYRTGMFFLRKDGLESHLAIANLQFPEHAANPNGESVAYHVRLYGEHGEHLATSRKMMLRNNATAESTALDLFPDVTGDVVGAMYVDIDDVAQTGSLRPYGVLVNTAGDALARCHYHDKFALFTDPGFFQNTSPFEPGQTCWMAISNCQGKRYESEYHLQADRMTLSGNVTLDPMESRWVKLADLFPELDPARASLSPGLFWLENPQHVMVYFFWHIAASNVWMGQHH